MITKGAVINTTIAEILRDIQLLRVPVDIKSFAELHDFVDANTYAGVDQDEFLRELRSQLGDDDLVHDFISDVQAFADGWLSATDNATAFDSVTRVWLQRAAPLIRHAKTLEGLIRHAKTP
jgi:hypothetical protein